MAHKPWSARTRRVARGGALAVFVALAAGAVRASGDAPPARVVVLLDAYASGDYRGALNPISNLPADQVPALRQDLVVAGLSWIDSSVEARPGRLLLAAAFALEAEAVLAERGLWSVTAKDMPCAARCVLEWACARLRERGAPDAIEEVWAEASLALAGGVRDWIFLISPLTPPTARRPAVGHVLHLLERFPDAPRIRLARAVAIASRLMVTTEMDTPREGERTNPAVTLAPPPGPAGAVLEDRRQATLAYATRQFADLVFDASVGAEARARLAQMHMRSTAFDQALAAATMAAGEAADPDVRYIAHVIAAQASQALGDLRSAERHYGLALAARPGSQSATLGLAALTHRRGDGEAAYALIAQSPFGDDDPWRLFLYGDFPRLPRLIAELRRGVTR